MDWILSLKYLFKLQNMQNIIIFDPDDFYITMLDLITDQMGLKLVGSAFNLDSSKILFNKIKTGKIKPDIAIIEAHMGKSEYDGQKIAEKLRDIVKGIKIIGFSTYKTDHWADEEAIKTLKDNQKSIISVLSKLTGKEYALENKE